MNPLKQLLQTRGREQYAGEPVSHLSHACHAATFAQRSRSKASLVAAAPLHEIGHLLSSLPCTPSADCHNDRHEDVAAQALSHLFAAQVAEPIRLHVAAKRRPCMNAPLKGAVAGFLAQPGAEGWCFFAGWGCGV